LLVAVLARPGPAAERRVAVTRLDAKRLVVRRAGLGDDVVADPAAATGELFLKRRLEVEQRSRREVDLGREGGEQRLRGAVEAELQIAGADQRLDDRRHRALAADQLG